jgi:hypothetical protein
MRNLFHSGSARFPLAAALLILMSGCVTHGHLGDLTVDRLDEIPPDARIVVDTVDGRVITIRVTESGPDHVIGVDRHYQEYRFRRDEISAVRVRPQNDLIIALAFFAVVFVTGF